MSISFVAESCNPIRHLTVLVLQKVPIGENGEGGTIRQRFGGRERAIRVKKGGNDLRLSVLHYKSPCLSEKKMKQAIRTVFAWVISYPFISFVSVFIM